MASSKKRSRLLLALLGTVAVVGVAIGVAAPLVTLAKSGAVEFGFVRVRSGIPEDTPRFQVSSPDLQNRQPFSTAEVANIFGCTGGNQAPRLQWTGAPAGTKSFVVTMFDPDAPSGSGFWHWLTWDIPATAKGLDAAHLPPGAVAGTNDAGLTGYLGPCPPVGDRVHHYQLTVYALDIPSLVGLGSETRGAVLGFSMRLDILAIARMTATFSR